MRSNPENDGIPSLRAKRGKPEKFIHDRLLFIKSSCAALLNFFSAWGLRRYLVLGQLSERAFVAAMN